MLSKFSPPLVAFGGSVLLLAGLAVYRRGQRSIAALHERLAL